MAKEIAWKSKAKISPDQLGKVVNDATAQSQDKFTFDMPIAHPSMTEIGRLVKREGATGTVRMPNGENKDFPINELFDPRIAEKLADGFSAAAPVPSAPAPEPGPPKK